MKIKIYDSNRQMYRYMTVPFTLEGGGPTDEGYHWWKVEYYSAYGRIYAERQTASRDCDGPHETYSVHWCFPPSRKDDYVAKWHKLESNQRDYFAEAMGY